MNKPESVLTDVISAASAAHADALEKYGPKNLLTKDLEMVCEFLAKMAEKAEPVAMMNPRETFVGDAFIWGGPDARHPEYSQAVYTHHPTTAALVPLLERSLSTLQTVTTLQSRKLRDQLPGLMKELRAAIEAHKGKA